MDDNKKVYTKADFDNFAATVRRESEQTMSRQRERIEELRRALDEAETKNKKYESQKELVYKAITAALKKADDIERVSLIKYNQEIAQLKSFHDKWIGYFNRIIAAYPLDDDLVAASKINGKIAEVLGKTGDIEAQYNDERERLMRSIEEEEEEEATADEAEQAATAEVAKPAQESEVDPKEQDEYYADRSPSGFSFAEALHPKDDLKDIMRELGIIMDDD